MKIQFRNKSPIRTCTKKFKDYKRYKVFLRKDFNNRCGYTDCPDVYFGGPNSFHIDHFKPYDRNISLKTNYSNLVYSCSYVNILKSNDKGLYLDPCNVDFNEHFERDFNGKILPRKSSRAAKYMYSKLKLYLIRYQIIWILDELKNKIIFLQKYCSCSNDEKIKSEIKDICFQLTTMYFEYFKYLDISL